MLIDRTHDSDIMDVRSFRGPDCDTDHGIMDLLKIKFRQRINKMGKLRCVKQKIFDCERLLKGEGLQGRYCHILEEKMLVTRYGGLVTGKDVREFEEYNNRQHKR